MRTHKNTGEHARTRENTASAFRARRDKLRRFVSIEIHHDPSQVWVLLFSITLLGGLLVSLFVPRRRVWIKVRDSAEGTVLEYAGLARGEDARLADAVADLAIRHTTALGVPAPERHTEPRMDA